MRSLPQNSLTGDRLQNLDSRAPAPAGAFLCLLPDRRPNRPETASPEAQGASAGDAVGLQYHPNGQPQDAHSQPQPLAPQGRIASKTKGSLSARRGREGTPQAGCASAQAATAGPPRRHRRSCPPAPLRSPGPLQPAPPRRRSGRRPPRNAHGWAQGVAPPGRLRRLSSSAQI